MRTSEAGKAGAGVEMAIGSFWLPAHPYFLFISIGPGLRIIVSENM
jgi:hypothetical protein